MALSALDPTSYSEPEKCIITAVDLDWTINFDRQTIGGVAQLNFSKETDQLEALVLDVRDLTIESVTLDTTGEALDFDISNPAGVNFGQKLTIQLKKAVPSEFSVSITYVTSSQSSALQWLTPEQTAGKRHPYLFSQCQAIHARSLYPCQDTPRVKFPYKAKVRAAKEMTVLMSAERLGVEEDKANPSQSISTFSMKVPIPSYLLAIVAGDLECRKIGPRSHVWSEREFVDAAANEFVETESFIQTAESLVGPYVWGHYDLLVLPPSFPYGGMENPCLTFVTPTLLAGDRSLADVIAHEISHSWTGNLVTNNTFEHFWLNEGHTMFLQRKIEGNLYGEPHRQVQADLGWRTLRETVQKLTEDNEVPYTKLVPDLIGVDPDDAFSPVPYEKGFALLYYLETLLGGAEVFNPFLRAYIENFKYRCLDTCDWKNFLYEYFSFEEDQQRLNSVDWEAWLYGTGMPPYEPNFDLSLAQPSRDLYQRWRDQPEDQLDVFSRADIAMMPSFLIREFLSSLKEEENTPLTLRKVQALEEKYSFNSVRNCEIRVIWLELCLKVRWNDAIQRALDFVNEQGRMKFVEPMYRSLYAWEEARPRAIDNFNRHRQEMHPTTVNRVARKLHLEE